MIKKDSIFYDFTNQFAVDKTVCFGLRPVAETIESLNKIISDTERDKHYPNIKELLDDYYRHFIKAVLDEFKFEKEELEVAYSKFLEIIQNKLDVEMRQKYRKEYTQIKSDLAGRIGKSFKNKIEDYGLGDYGKLWKNEDSPLNIFLNKQFENQVIDEELYKLRKEAILAFKGFATYFTAFKNNRDNMFAAELKYSSIADRICNENLDIFFNNLKLFNDIKEGHPDLYDKIKVYEKNFDAISYNNALTDEGINAYNLENIGHKAEDRFAEGINQLINKYNQDSLANLGVMKKLNKQILSKSGIDFTNVITNDEMLFQTVEESVKQAIPALINIYEICEKAFKKNQSKNIFIKTSFINSISNALFSDYSLINAAVSSKLKTLTKKEQKRFDKVISINELNEIVNNYIAQLEEYTGTPPAIEYYFTNVKFDALNKAYDEFKTLSKQGELHDDKSIPTSNNPKGGYGYQQLEVIKKLLDGINQSINIYKPLLLEEKGEKMAVEDVDMDFYVDFEYEYKSISDFYQIYNSVRNYVTKSSDNIAKKVRQFFDCSSLLTSWGRSYINNECLLAENEGKYYLIKMLATLSSDEEKMLETAKGDAYRIAYVTQKIDSKNFPRVFIRSKGTKIAPAVEKYNLPVKDILDIYDKKQFKKEFAKQDAVKHKEALTKMIDYFKLGVSRHEDYKDFNYVWKPSADYSGIDQFYNDTIKCSYKIGKIGINFDYLLELARNQKILLFQIYSKDFSKYSTGRKNLHTLYWEMLFNKDNIVNIKEGRPYFKLNGNAHIFARDASIKMRVTHPKNTDIENKNPLAIKKYSKFSYDLFKDKRFAEKKWLFHCPITINFGAEKVFPGPFNKSVNNVVEKNESVNIIGIDRGERHLLYYTVINQRGEILDKGSFNTIESGVTTKDGSKINMKTDYHELLNRREKERAKAREDWGTIEQIKNLKDGYMSNIVHKLSQLMIEYNAIVVLEDLNSGFKNSRKKIEKQVYQKFEIAFLNKLNYLAFKNLGNSAVGSIEKGLQLAPIVDSLKDTQYGFVYYVDPSYTSTICPKTGFVKTLDTRYTNISNAQQFFQKFVSIRFNPNQDYFEFTYNISDFSKDMKIAKDKWTLCTFGSDRYYYSQQKVDSAVPGEIANNNRKWVPMHINVTEQLKEVLDNFSIDYRSGENIIAAISNQNDAGFFKNILFLLRITQQLRYVASSENGKDDYILSPIAGEDGKFFDSRNAAENEPDNADANGAYHIALKGLWKLKNIKDGKTESINKESWLKYRQLGEY